MKTRLSTLAGLILVLLADYAGSYPLDGEGESGIRRLQGYQLVQQAPTGPKLSRGQLWSVEDIKLRLLGYEGPDFDSLPQDPLLETALDDMLQSRDPSYSMVLVDISDPDNIRWAGLRPDLRRNAGSVGKLLCMTALFYALAEAFPDVEDRAQVLRTALSRADDWVSNEIHAVPKWNEELQINQFSVIQPEDQFRLSEWVDHAISASANGAGSIIWREAMLIARFGSSYPVSEEVRQDFFRLTPKTELSAIARQVITAPLIDAGMDVNNLQQGSFFTSNAKRKVPGIISFATTRELARLLFRIEEGRLVDAWSSLQMKKYMYLTKRRYRYAYAPELANQAVFFKSGSLYSCHREEGFRCDKYMGNTQNLMNSVAVVEGSGGDDPRYIVTLTSNVLRFNSAWDHSRIGAATDAIVRTRAPQKLQESVTDKELKEVGKSE